MNWKTIKGIIFDYGGTLDSRGVHWSEVLWAGWQHAGVDVTKEQFREAYVHAERALAKSPIILPEDNFLTLLRKKVKIELEFLGLYSPESCETIAQYCYQAAKECIEESRPVLDALSERYPLVLVSNFYGNVSAVLADFDLLRYFPKIIESAVVGVRKPDPAIFQLGVDALGLPAQEVLVVGDSLKKDILPAESIGCQTAWLKGKGWTSDEDAQTHPSQIPSLASLIGEINQL
ncbi:MAG: HAD family hydrolase [Muribaculaceae bacterium]|nr:HAD family hydrolase [Muribaculaceae bacterium]